MAQHQAVFIVWEASQDPDRVLPLPGLGCHLKSQEVRPAAPLSLLPDCPHRGPWRDVERKGREALPVAQARCELPGRAT